MRSRLLAVPLVFLALAIAGCASATPGGDATPAPSACEYVENSGAVKEVAFPDAAGEASGTVEATLQTSAGDIPMTLDADRTPCTVGSFVSLADQGYYDDSPCHRLTTSGIFVLQCGDPSGTGMGGPGYRYGDELDGSETYPAGTVAMANAGPDTNGSQFFLVYEDTALPPSYTVFGELSPEGLAVVQAIAAEGVEGGAGDGAPVTPITITGVTLEP
jgi:peptidyl-prolyl cis-trans isomerase B (cyclophilin B)